MMYEAAADSFVARNASDIMVTLYTNSIQMELYQARNLFSIINNIRPLKCNDILFKSLRSYTSNVIYLSLLSVL